jgi:hypothetical protein
MKYTATPFGNTVIILANDHYFGVAKAVTIADGTEVVKAGTPIDESGNPITTGTAFGVLMHDVTADNPNGTVIVHGCIDKKKAQEHSGVTYDEATIASMPMIKFI